MDVLWVCDERESHHTKAKKQTVPLYFLLTMRFCCYCETRQYGLTKTTFSLSLSSLQLQNKGLILKYTDIRFTEYGHAMTIIFLLRKSRLTTKYENKKICFTGKMQFYFLL